VKFVQIITVGAALILVDHFYCADQYRHAAWDQAKVAGERISAEFSRWSLGTLWH